MAAFWPTDAGLRGDPAVASRMNAFDKIVVSRTLTEAAWGPVTVLSDDVAAQLAKIKGQPGQAISPCSAALTSPRACSALASSTRSASW